MTEEVAVAELSPQKRFSCNLIAAILIAVCGVFLLLSGVGVIPVDITLLIAPAILFTFALMFFVTAIIQNNMVALYLSLLFFVCALVSTLAHFVGGLGYDKLYPLYIGAPAIASLITMIISKNYSSHLKVAVVFGVPSLLFLMQALGVWSWAVTLPCVILFVGLLCLCFVLAVRSRPEE